MTGREVTQMAFELKQPRRLPVVLIAGGSWRVQLAEGAHIAFPKELISFLGTIFLIIRKYLF
jgi:hypothetical protein